LDLKIVTLAERQGDLFGLQGEIDGAQWFETCPTTNPELACTPADLLYIVFTSGSTGQPKGIMQPHRSFCQYIRWHKDIFRIGPGKRLAQWASIAYDASYCKIFGALCFGATICLTTPARRYDPAALVDWIREEKIDVLHMVPSFSRQLLEAVNARYESTEDPWPELECFSLAGEALTADLARGWRRRLASADLYNMYGPSECILASYYQLDQLDQAQRAIPIGKAIGGRQLIILDAAGRLCPIGVTGEIYIRSPYLTNGYWRRPEETAKAFINNPLHKDIPDPVYRTGDLGRWLPDGNVEFRGRKDQQVKLRGVRIEIEEIEYALRQHEKVREAAVAAHLYDESDQLLVAYVGLNTQEDIESELRQFLKQLLPEPLLPATFVVLEALPRTRTGKLDRKALPKPDLQRQVHDVFVAPRTPLESTIADIWRKLLKMEQISVEDNFFELGGHSIMATQAVNRIREKCGSKLSLPKFLASPVIADLARHIEAEQQLAEETKMRKLLESVKQLTADQAGVLIKGHKETQETQAVSSRGE
jgi:amino acid adenylation domain-containing protein